MPPRSFVYLAFLLALILRFIYPNSLTFYYDQGRDALLAQELFSDPIKLIGPPTDIPGVHHGALFYYLLAPLYLFLDGNPYLVRIFFILIQSLTIFPLFYFCSQLFPYSSVPRITSLLFATSPLLIQYSRWLSNPSPAITSTFFTLFFFHLAITRHSKYLPLSLACWAISFNFQFFLLHQIIPIFLVTIKHRKQFQPKYIYLSILATIVFLSPFLLSEIKFSFQATKALLAFLFHSAPNHSNLSSQLSTQSYYYLNSCLPSITPFISTVILTFLAILTLVKFFSPISPGPLLFIFLFSFWPLVLSLFKSTNAQFINLGSEIPFLILISYFFSRLHTSRIFRFFLLIFLFSNLNFTFTHNHLGETLFTLPDKINLADQQTVLNWIYEQSASQPFYLNTITTPLFINSQWAYLFSWYSQTHSTPLPIWWGETQVNVAGSNIHWNPPSSTTTHFVIKDPLPPTNTNFHWAIDHFENKRSFIVKEAHIGNFTVEKRHIYQPFTYTSQDVFNYIRDTIK